MKECKNCGGNFENSSKYCDKCGIELSEIGIKESQTEISHPKIPFLKDDYKLGYDSDGASAKSPHNLLNITSPKKLDTAITIIDVISILTIIGVICLLLFTPDSALTPVYIDYIAITVCANRFVVAILTALKDIVSILQKTYEK